MGIPGVIKTKKVWLPGNTNVFHRLAATYRTVWHGPFCTLTRYLGGTYRWWYLKGWCWWVELPGSWDQEHTIQMMVSKGVVLMGGIDRELGPGTTQAILLNKNNNNGVILFSYGEHSIPIKVFRFNIFELRIKLKLIIIQRIISCTHTSFFSIQNN